EGDPDDRSARGVGEGAQRTHRNGSRRGMTGGKRAGCAKHLASADGLRWENWYARGGVDASEVIQISANRGVRPAQAQIDGTGRSAARRKAAAQKLSCATGVTSTQGQPSAT